MILIYIGGIGSGKTLSIIREIITRKSLAFTNFKLNLPDNAYHRLKFTDIMQITANPLNKKKMEYKVNWTFWENVMNNKKKYDIYLDEIHNIASSRRSQSHKNVCLSSWISQVRKILMDSDNNLYVISQTLGKIDKDIRDLAGVIVVCVKETRGIEVWVHQYWYEGLDDYLSGITTFPHHTKFLGNAYFTRYNYTELIKFSDAEVYL